MPQLTAPDQDTVNSWGIRELGVKDGSSPTVNFDVAGSTAVREFLCNWDDRYRVAKWFVGDVSTYLDGSTLKISRLLPQALPKPPREGDEPEWPDFHATKVMEITGHAWRDFDPEGAVLDPDDPVESQQFGDRTGIDRVYEYVGVGGSDVSVPANRFLCAKLKVQYEKLPYNLLEDEETSYEGERWVQYVPEGDSSPDYVTIPSSTQRYISSTGTGTGHDVPVPYPVGLTEGVYRFVLRWHRIPKNCWGPGSALWARIFGDGTTANLPWLNAVNDATFYYESLPIGTVMLEKVTEKLDPSMIDSNFYLWTIDYHFAVKPGLWNSSWFFPNVTEFAGAGNAAKRMFVGRGSTYYAPGSVPDLYSNYIERDLDTGLWSVD